MVGVSMILDNPSGNGGRNTAVDVLRVLAGIVDDIEKKSTLSDRAQTWWEYVLRHGEHD